jgi:hypothetical protein
VSKTSKKDSKLEMKNSFNATILLNNEDIKMISPELTNADFVLTTEEGPLENNLNNDLTNTQLGKINLKSNIIRSYQV